MRGRDGEGKVKFIRGDYTIREAVMDILWGALQVYGMTILCLAVIAAIGFGVLKLMLGDCWK